MAAMFSIMRAGCALLVLAMTACAAHPPKPGPPPETAGYFVMPDGARLPYRTWLPKGKPWAVVLALHGFNDSRDAWEMPAALFADAGVAVYAPDQRGFGAAPDRGRWPGVTPLVDDARSMARLVHAAYPQTPLYLMGESMGGALLVLLATRPDPPDAAGYVLVAPAVWGSGQMNVLLRAALWMAVKVAPGWHVSGNEVPLRIYASDNNVALHRLVHDPLTLRSTRIDTLQGLVKLMTEAQAAAPDFHAPALVLYGARDRIVPPEATRPFWRALPPSARLAYYPGGFHLLLRDLDRALPTGDILAWLRDPEAPLPSGAETAARAWLAQHPSHGLPPARVSGYAEATDP